MALWLGLVNWFLIIKIKDININKVANKWMINTNIKPLLSCKHNIMKKALFS